MKTRMSGLIVLVFLAFPAKAQDKLVEQLAEATELPQIKAQPRSIRHEIVCLALNIYHEGRGAGRQELTKIANVTLNRVASRNVNVTICGNVFMVRQLRNRKVAQFHWVTERQDYVPHEHASWAESLKISYNVYTAIDRQATDPTKGACYFSNRRDPHTAWTKAMKLAVRTKYHVFLIYECKDPMWDRRPQKRLARLAG